MATKAEKFFNEVYNSARKQGANHIQATLAASQSALETGWGASVKGNSYFGVKSGKNYTGDTVSFTTNEAHWDKPGQATFRAFNSLDESVADYMKVMEKTWPDAWNATTISKAVSGLGNEKPGGYATGNPKDKGRVDKNLNSIANKYSPSAKKQAVNLQVATPKGADVTTDPIYNGLLGDLNATPEKIGLTDLEKLGSFREAQDLQHDPVTAPTQRPGVTFEDALPTEPQVMTPEQQKKATPFGNVEDQNKPAPNVMPKDRGVPLSPRMSRIDQEKAPPLGPTGEIRTPFDKGQQTFPPQVMTPEQQNKAAPFGNVERDIWSELKDDSVVPKDSVEPAIAAKDNAVNAGDPNRYTDSFTEYNKMVGRVDPVEKAITEEEVKQGIKPPEAMYNSLLNDELNKGLTNFDDLPFAGDYPADPPVTTPTFRPSVTTPTFRPDSFAGGDIPVPTPRPAPAFPASPDFSIRPDDPNDEKPVNTAPTPEQIKHREKWREDFEKQWADSQIPDAAPVQQQNVATDTLNGSYNTERELEGRVDREDAVTRLMARESIPNGLAPFDPVEFALIEPTPVKTVTTDSSGRLGNPFEPTPVKTIPVGGAKSYPDISGVQRGIPEYPGQGTFGDLGGGWVPDPAGFKKALGTSAGLDTSYLTGDRSSQFDRAFDPFNTTNIHKSEGRLSPDGSSSSNIPGPSSVNTTEDSGKTRSIAETVRDRINSADPVSHIQNVISAPSNDQPASYPVIDSKYDSYDTMPHNKEAIDNPYQQYNAASNFKDNYTMDVPDYLNYGTMALGTGLNSLTNDEFYDGLTELDWTDPTKANAKSLGVTGMTYTDAKDAIEKKPVGKRPLTDPGLLPVKPNFLQQILGVNPNRYGTKGLLTNIAKGASRGMSAAGPFGGFLGGLFGAVNSAPKRTFDQTMSMYQNNPNMQQVDDWHSNPSENSFSVYSSPKGNQSIVRSGSGGKGTYDITNQYGATTTLNRDSNTPFTA